MCGIKGKVLISWGRGWEIGGSRGGEGRCSRGLIHMIVLVRSKPNHRVSTKNIHHTQLLWSPTKILQLWVDSHTDGQAQVYTYMLDLSKNQFILSTYYGTISLLVIPPPQKKGGPTINLLWINGLMCTEDLSHLVHVNRVCDMVLGISWGESFALASWLLGLDQPLWNGYHH